MQSLCDLSAMANLFCSPPQDVIRKTMEDKMKMEEERKEREKKAAVFSSQKSALDRFKK